MQNCADLFLLAELTDLAAPQDLVWLLLTIMVSWLTSVVLQPIMSSRSTGLLSRSLSPTIMQMLVQEYVSILLEAGGGPKAFTLPLEACTDHTSRFLSLRTGETVPSPSESVFPVDSPLALLPSIIVDIINWILASQQLSRLVNKQQLFPVTDRYYRAFTTASIFHVYLITSWLILPLGHIATRLLQIGLNTILGTFYSPIATSSGYEITVIGGTVADIC